ncbi:nitrate reductase [Rhizorhapis suberifaciens]|uniref:Assimilatory nitrate reductase catalytic subunit n=1 Tax=Rhizorhapis suberifaciens TaxID=13656 RepID=A0A840HTG1_9SPHN|nr:nitrate reductase [Rhizorhapis suberifaciens]MBB4640897.1 assimilatory nitrate reductase catalytic subunit [Rhizorhapis suberifaciens]
MTTTRTTCPYCGVGCGVSATVTGPRTVEIKGDANHPANGGRLCSKGTHLGETVGLGGRLLHPVINGQQASWDTALDAVAKGFSDTIAEHGPDSVAFYVSGQLLTEDYYVANKLMKGFIGSSNIDTNSRLCMASAVAAYNRAFGEDVVPCTYEDLEQADLIVLVGSNTAWCHPIIWQRIEAARAARGTKLVVIDPRRTETAEGADLHLPIRPDGDIALFNGLLAAMREDGRLDQDYLAAHVDVPENFWNSLPTSSAGRGIEEWAEDCGVAPEALAQFYDLFARHPRTVTLFSQGANQSICGTDKGNAIINLHLATGRIGKPGMGPFSITGQPNAMGGREVGGLASTLAAHMGFTPEELSRVQRFWNSPTMVKGPGLKAVDMFRAVHDGRIKAIWIMATNPAVSMPDADFVREALAKCPLVVVSDVMANTDTGAFAHIKLPALAWAEKDGTVTNSERMISRQRGFFAAPGEARADWDIIAEVGRRMGHDDAFAFDSAASVFREYCAQTAFENDGRRKLDLSSWADLSDADYDALKPMRWAGLSPFADGRFTTPNRRARMIGVQRPAAPVIDPAFPFRLNTGRYRDQWHTMTRTALSPRLSQHRREPLVEVHPADAATLHIHDGGLARVRTVQGEAMFRVIVTASQRQGELFVPMHWTDQVSSGGRANRLPNQNVDPFSGQPAFKNSAAAIEPVTPAWTGFLVSRDRPQLDGVPYWTLVRQRGGWLVELAGFDDMDLEHLLPKGERVEALDRARGVHRAAVLNEDGKLAAALFLSRSGRLPERDWIVGQLDSEEQHAGLALLAGRPAQPPPDRGPIICVCFDVGMKTILSAIAGQQLTSVEAVGAALSAGTNCGSCRPAIKSLLEERKEAVNA